MSQAFKVEDREGQHIRIFGGAEFLVKVSAEQSGGVFSLLDSLNPAGTFLPPHIHHNEDETFYILEGEFEFTVGDGAPIKAGAGATVYAPRGVPHSFRVTSSVPGRTLVLTHPGGFEKCMEALSKLPDASDMPSVLSTCAEHGIEFLPPPNV